MSQHLVPGRKARRRDSGTQRSPGNMSAAAVAPPGADIALIMPCWALAISVLRYAATPPFNKPTNSL